MSQSRWLKVLMQPLYLIAAFAILCIVATFLGRLFWAFEFANYFVLHGSAVLVIVASLLLLARKRFEAAACLAFAVIGMFYIVPLYIPVKPQSSCEPVQRAILINLLKENQNYQLVRDYVRSRQPDIVVFEEVTPAWDDELELLRDEYSYWISEPQRDHTGIAILSKIPDNEVEITVIGQNSPPSIVSRFDLAGSRVMLIATHPAPPFGPIAMETKKRHFEALAGLIDSHEGVVIVLGDLNMTSRSSLFQWFIHKTDLKDSRLGYGLQATYPVGLSLLGIDLDHALVSSGITVHYRGLGPDLGSDHYPVELEYSLKCQGRANAGPERTRGGWETADENMGNTTAWSNHNTDFAIDLHSVLRLRICNFQAFRSFEREC